jgi:FkbM family methyltransferase
VRRLINKLPKSCQAPLRNLWRRLDLVIMRRRRIATFAVAQYYRALLQDRQIDCVLDVGANEGQFALFLRSDVGYRGKIISFEPVSQVFKILESQAEKDDNWEVICTALGEESGNATINVASSSVFSSLLKISSDDLFHSFSQPTAQEQVRVCRLDSFGERFSGFRHFFLKTDTQGFDLAVLRGTQGILDRVDCIQIELSLVPIYEGMPGWRDVLQELEGRGFALSNVFPIAMSHLRAIEFDCIVVRPIAASPGDHYPYDDILLRRRKRRLSSLV